MRPLLATRLHDRAEGALGRGFHASGHQPAPFARSPCRSPHSPWHTGCGSQRAGGQPAPCCLTSSRPRGPTPRPLAASSHTGPHQGPSPGPQLGPRTPSTAQRSRESTSPQLDCQGPSHLYISQACPEKPPAHTPHLLQGVGRGDFTGPGVPR